MEHKPQGPHVHFVEVSFGEIQKRRPAHVDFSHHPVHAKEKDREGSQPCERRNKENTPHRPRKIPQRLQDLQKHRFRLQLNQFFFLVWILHRTRYGRCLLGGFRVCRRTLVICDQWRKMPYLFCYRVWVAESEESQKPQ